MKRLKMIYGTKLDNVLIIEDGRELNKLNGHAAKKILKRYPQVNTIIHKSVNGNMDPWVGRYFAERGVELFAAYITVNGEHFDDNHCAAAVVRYKIRESENKMKEKYGYYTHFAQEPIGPADPGNGSKTTMVGYVYTHGLEETLNHPELSLVVDLIRPKYHIGADIGLPLISEIVKSVRETRKSTPEFKFSDGDIFTMTHVGTTYEVKFKEMENEYGTPHLRILIALPEPKLDNPEEFENRFPESFDSYGGFQFTSFMYLK